MLITEPLAINVTLAFHRYVEELEGCPLPEVVAAVNQLVNASVEPTLGSDLPLDQPAQATFKVKLLVLTKKQHSCKPAESVTTMRLAEGRA